MSIATEVITANKTLFDFAMIKAPSTDQQVIRTTSGANWPSSTHYSAPLNICNVTAHATFPYSSLRLVSSS